ncbi:hypothetical protein PQX77_009735, partial [Marasmius sp. AFHP31]
MPSGLAAGGGGNRTADTTAPQVYESIDKQHARETIHGHVYTSRTFNHNQVASQCIARKFLVRKAVSKSDEAGKLYVLQGVLNGEVFIKVGRSVDVERRFQEHCRNCRAVTWTEIGSWDVQWCHRAEALTHIRMGDQGFVRFLKKCSCVKRHRERFERPGMSVKCAIERVIHIIRTHKKITRRTAYPKKFGRKRVAALELLIIIFWKPSYAQVMCSKRALVQ